MILKKINGTNTTKEVNDVYKVHTPSLYKYIQNKKNLKILLKIKKNSF